MECRRPSLVMLRHDKVLSRYAQANESTNQCLPGGYMARFVFTPRHIDSRCFNAFVFIGISHPYDIQRSVFRPLIFPNHQSPTNPPSILSEKSVHLHKVAISTPQTHLNTVVSLGGLGIGSVIERSLGVAGQVVEGRLALVLAGLGRLGTALVVWVGGLVDLAAGLALWLWRVTALLWCGHCGWVWVLVNEV